MTTDPMPAEGMQVAAFVDVETTGLAAFDELIECAVVLFEYSPETGQVGRELESYCGLREPSVPIGAGAAALHGISAADVAGQDLDHERIRRMLGAARIIISHNAPFDRRFMVKLYPEVLRMVWCCSMTDVNWKAHGHRNRKLHDLLRSCGIPIEHAHRATDDVLAAIRLLAHSGPGGKPNMHELLSSLSARHGRTIPNRLRW